MPSTSAGGSHTGHDGASGEAARLAILEVQVLRRDALATAEEADAPAPSRELGLGEPAALEIIHYPARFSAGPSCALS